jgi:hypothetical protein
VGSGADVQGSPAPVSASLHADAADRLRAVAVTGDGGTSVHLELWLNGKKLIDYTGRDHPYIKGFLSRPVRRFDLRRDQHVRGGIR